MSPVTLERDGAIAILRIDNPPVNALSASVRAGLLAAAEALAADPAPAGVLLLCAGRTFVAGADISEFGKPTLQPALRDVCAAIEALTRPVVAVLQGTALGGGLELALSCHYRLIDPEAKVGLPEVTLGLVPGAGGTQRLPRLIGLEAATDLIATGRRIDAAEALRIGLADALIEGDRDVFARAFLRRTGGSALPRPSARPFPAAAAGVLAAARSKAAKAMPGQVAPQRAIDLLDASASKDFSAGLALERSAFEDLRSGPQAAALRHMFFAERAIGKVPGLGTARPLSRIGIVGGGTMGAAIAAACLLAGLSVRLAERDAAAAGAAAARVEAILAEAVRRGKLPAEDCEAIRTSRFATATELAALGEVDLIIEAVFEALDVKRQVFAALAAVARPGTVLASNTSYLDIGAIAAATVRPQDVIGLHFFAPAHIMKLVEIVVPEGADPDAVATGFALGQKLGKLAVRAANREGFIGNRILSAYRRAADQMVEDGATPAEVDAAFRSFGFPMGVFEMQDLAGLDIGWATRQRLAPHRDPAERYVRIADRLCESGAFGRKTGIGFYVHDEGCPRPNPALDAIIAEERRAKGIVPRAFAPDEIADRVLLAMINEGAKILDEGVALRAGDIDVVMVHGYGFPRWRGGPMFAAEARGLGVVLADLEALGSGDPLWRPARRLRDGAAARSGFGG